MTSRRRPRLQSASQSKRPRVKQPSLSPSTLLDYFSLQSEPCSELLRKDHSRDGPRLEQKYGQILRRWCHCCNCSPPCSGKMAPVIHFQKEFVDICRETNLELEPEVAFFRAGAFAYGYCPKQERRAPGVGDFRQHWQGANGVVSSSLFGGGKGPFSRLAHEDRGRIALQNYKAVESFCEANGDICCTSMNELELVKKWRKAADRVKSLCVRLYSSYCEFVREPVSLHEVFADLAEKWESDGDNIPTQQTFDSPCEQLSLSVVNVIDVDEESFTVGASVASTAKNGENPGLISQPNLRKAVKTTNETHRVAGVDSAKYTSKADHRRVNSGSSDGKVSKRESSIKTLREALTMGWVHFVADDRHLRSLGPHVVCRLLKVWELNRIDSLRKYLEREGEEVQKPPTARPTTKCERSSTVQSGRQRPFGSTERDRKYPSARSWHQNVSRSHSKSISPWRKDLRSSSSSNSKICGNRRYSREETTRALVACWAYLTPEEWRFISDRLCGQNCVVRLCPSLSTLIYKQHVLFFASAGLAPEDPVALRYFSLDALRFVHRGLINDESIPRSFFRKRQMFHDYHEALTLLNATQYLLAAEQSEHALNFVHKASDYLLQPLVATDGQGNADPSDNLVDDAGLFATLFQSECIERVIYTGVTILEKKKRYEEALHYICLLLGAGWPYNCSRYRGTYWLRNVQDLLHMKAPAKALETCEKALQDPHVTGADRIALRHKFQRLAVPPFRWEPLRIPPIPTGREMVLTLSELEKCAWRRESCHAKEAEATKSTLRAGIGDLPELANEDEFEHEILVESEESSDIATQSQSSLSEDVQCDANEYRKAGNDGAASVNVDQVQDEPQMPLSAGSRASERIENKVLNFLTSRGQSCEGWKGMHAENGVFLTIFTLVCWDILYPTCGGSAIAENESDIDSVTTDRKDSDFPKADIRGCNMEGETTRCCPAIEGKASGAGCYYMYPNSYIQGPLDISFPSIFRELRGKHMDNFLERLAGEGMMLHQESERVQRQGGGGESCAAQQSQSKLSAASDVEELIRRTWKKYAGTLALGVNWYRNSLNELLCICRGLGTKVIAEICRALAEDYHGYSHGIPDLILWNNDNVRLVEVKGPGDSLSYHQRAWIERLAKVDFQVDVCYVLAKK